VIGLASGDAVVVHASLRAVGLGADEVIGALLDAVGPRGLVVMPTFTYDNEAFDTASWLAETISGRSSSQSVHIGAPSDRAAIHTPMQIAAVISAIEPE